MDKIARSIFLLFTLIVLIVPIFYQETNKIQQRRLQISIENGLPLIFYPNNTSKYISDKYDQTANFGISQGFLIGYAINNKFIPKVGFEGYNQTLVHEKNHLMINNVLYYAGFQVFPFDNGLFA